MIINTIKILIICVVCCMLTNTVFAQKRDDGSGILLVIRANDSPQQVQIQVPLQIPILLKNNGTVLVDKTLQISNNSENIKVSLKSMYITPINGWCIKNYSNQFRQTDKKEFAMEFYGDKSLENGNIDISPKKWQINPGESVYMNINVKISRQNIDTESAIAIGKLHYIFTV